jgi:hypothetical protein
MTKDQIDTIALLGVPRNTWVNIGDKFKYILLNSDRTLFCHGASVRFFFPSNKNFFLVRNLDGKLIPSNLVSDPIGYELFSYQGDNYYIKSFSGGKDYLTFGNYHEIISLDDVTGIFKV